MPLLPDNPSDYNYNTIFTFGDNILSILLTAAAYIAVIFLIWGAIQYIMGALNGEDAKTSKGKATLMWAIAGVVVILLSRIILAQLFNILGANLTPEIQQQLNTNTQQQPAPNTQQPTPNPRQQPTPNPRQQPTPNPNTTQPNR